MRLFRGVLALVLSYALGVQPAVAQVEAVHFAAPAPGAGAAVSAAAAAAPGLNGALPVLTTLSPTLSAPSALLPSAPAAALEAASAPSAVPSAAAALAAPRAEAARAQAETPSFAATRAASARSVSWSLTKTRAAADKAVSGLSRASDGSARASAEAQFAALTGERLAAADAPGAPSAPAEAASSRAAAPALARHAAAAADAPQAGPPAPAPVKKPGIFQVFRDPARNKAFWRYVSGYSIFLFGFEMYVVGLPYLISSMTTNALRDSHDARLNNHETVKELIRSNRSLSRIAHWVAQAFSYASIPLFTRNAGDAGPRKWLVRSMFARAVVLGLVPVVFFSTGLLGLQGAMWVLFGLIAAQSFFQGISVTSEGAATTRLLGDRSVTQDERTKANSILTVIGAVIAILGPAIAGQIANIGPVLGKSGVGGAVIYGIYAGAVAVTGLIYATIKMFGGKSEVDAAAPASADDAAAPKGLGGTLKGLWLSIKDGTKIVFSNRLLRTMLAMSMIGSLFSDPLVFNVLPEYVGNLAAADPGAVGTIMHLPVIGAFLHSLTATAMGNFALMMVMASVGSIVATLLMKPMTRLFQRFGFKTEEGLTVPFYFMAALEAPLFLLMIHTPTLLGAVALYGLQSLAVGFVGIAISGLYQKTLGAQRSGDVNKVLAANSLIGIAAAIISTFVYGFILKDIAIGTSLTIAAIATGAVSLLRLAAPFLAFTKAERTGAAAKPASKTVPPAHAMPNAGEHHGPNSILSTHL
jgi:hypothetical protein